MMMMMMMMMMNKMWTAGNSKIRSTLTFTLFSILRYDWETLFLKA
jgi:hypothetical protein